MIYLGLATAEKAGRVAAYVAANDVEKVVVFYPKRHALPLDLSVPVEHVEWEDVIRYVFFYRLLQEVNQRTLLVFNEILRTPERSCLHYNCLRNYQTRTEQSIVFSRFPALESAEDFMILVDFDTRSRWRRSRMEDVSERLRVDVADVAPEVAPLLFVGTDSATRALYAQKKRELIDGIGSGDPHTIPRQLHLISGKHKASRATKLGGLWVGRNARLKVPGLVPYDEAHEQRQVLEFCHSLRDWSDYLTATEARAVSALVSDLKVDRWYLERAQRWTEMQHDAIAAIRQHNGS